MKDSLEKLLRLTAKLYHMDALSHTEIADLIGVSRPKVSRLLTRARELGIVRIWVDEYDPRNRELEAELKAQFQLNNVIITRILGENSFEGVRRSIGFFAAPEVSQWIHSNMIVGVAGSRTLHRLVQQLKPSSSVHGLTAVQLMGNIGAEVNNFDAIELCRDLAKLYRGTYFTLNAPALAPDILSRETYLAHQDVAAIWELFGLMQTAFVGLGSLLDSSFIERGVLQPGEVDLLRKSGAIGEICGRFFDRDGQECSTEFRDRMVGIRLDELREKREVVAVTIGENRADAVCATLRGGLVKSLIMDEAGAKAVLLRSKDGLRTTLSMGETIK
jgi:DNA-binding transcriptional regulator LsrR (DeoR family)